MSKDRKPVKQFKIFQVENTGKNAEFSTIDNLARKKLAAQEFNTTVCIYCF